MMEESWTTRLFGPELVECGGPDGETRATHQVLGHAPDIVGIYFSFANINAESDEFTQRLVEWYSQAPIKIVQVVLWALSDLLPDYQCTYKDSLKGLPWFAVPFHNVDVKRRLSHDYHINVGAPTLVLVEQGGVEVSRPALEHLVRMPSHFPWRPAPLSQLLRTLPLQHCSGGAAPVYFHELPADSVKAFYFGAHWCPPCKAFTPQLSETFSLLRKKGKDFHLVYVSSDRSEDSYERAVEGMPWLTVPWKDEEVRKEVARTLGVQGIPALRILRDGEEAYEVRAQAQGDPEGLNFPWLPSPVSILTEYHLQRLRDHPAIVLFVDGDEEEVAFALSVLKPAAEAYYEEWSIRHPNCTPPYVMSPHQDSIDFQYAQQTNRKTSIGLDFLIGVETEASDCVRDMCWLDDAVPLLTAVDYTTGRLYVMAIGEALTINSVQHFIDSYLAGHLTHKPLPPYPTT